MFRILLVYFPQACSLVALLYCTSNVKITAVPVINRNPKLQFKILTTPQCHLYLSTIVDTAEEKSSRCGVNTS
jgi:hypothetical protein